MEALTIVVLKKAVFKKKETFGYILDTNHCLLLQDLHLIQCLEITRTGQIYDVPGFEQGPLQLCLKIVSFSHC